MRSTFLAFLLSSAVLLAQPVAAPKPPAASPPKPAAAAVPKPAVPAREPGLYATINTSLGAIMAKLFEKESPITVRNFTALARGGKAWTDPKTKVKVTRSLYAGTVFHRVIPGFMIQGGDPTGTGMGDGGLEAIPESSIPR